MDVYQLLTLVAGVPLVAAAIAAVLPRRAAAATTLVTIIYMMVIVWVLPQGMVRYAGLNILYVTTEYNAMAVLLLLAEILALASLVDELDKVRAPLVILAVLGGLLVLYSASLLTLLAGIETAAAALAGLYSLGGRRSGEAAVKYLYSSILATTLIIVGTGLLYSQGFQSFTEAPLGGMSWVTLPALLGLVFLTAGLALETGLAPFYMWLPDVVQGAHLLGVVTAILLVDAPVLLVFFKLIASSGVLVGPVIAAILILLAMASMIVGEFSALAQKELRRMIGYSMVSDAGYTVLLAVVYALSGIRDPLVPIYFITASNMSIALVITAHRYERTSIGKIAQVTGLLSLAGTPPLYGFAAKLSVVAAFAAAGYTWLAVVSVVFFLVSAAYIFRYLIMGGYQASHGVDVPWPPPLAYSLLLLVLGIYPGLVPMLGGG